MNNQRLRELARQAGFEVDSDGKLSLYGGCKLSLRPNYQGTVADGIKILVDLAIQEERNVWENRLKEAKQEPVAWALTEELEKGLTTTNANLWFTNPQNSSWTPLYTTPQQRKPLTDAQYFEIGQRHWVSSHKVAQIHREIEEAAHGIKE
jgi:hypothetical protein